MKRFSILILISFVLVKCSDPKNATSGRDFAKEQKEYEEFKKSALKDKASEQMGSLIIKRSEELKNKAALLTELILDSTNQSFESDSTFFFENEIYFGGENVNSIFINDINNWNEIDSIGIPKFSSIGLKELNELNICLNDSMTSNCYDISENDLNALLNSRYLFLLNEVIYIEPEVVGSNFNGGTYIGLVSFIDIESNQTLHKFSVLGQNSETVEIGRYGTFAKSSIVSDLKKNINKSLETELKKYFIARDTPNRKYVGINF